MEQLEFTATENEAGVRIDRCLSDKYEELSRSYLQKLLKEQGVTVNGKAVKANYKIQAGDLVQTTLPDLTEPDILPENIPLDILYEDDDVLVINKPKGMVVHPANGHTSGTLVNAIMYTVRAICPVLTGLCVLESSTVLIRTLQELFLYARMTRLTVIWPSN